MNADGPNVRFVETTTVETEETTANHWSLKGMLHVDEPKGVGTRLQLITAADTFYIS